MKNTLRILVVFIFSVILFQNCQKSDFVVVTGVLRDSVTNLPVEGIRIEANGKEIFSASDGTFSLEGIQSGKYTVELYDRSQQYYSEKKDIIITAGRVNKIDFRLNPVPKPQIKTGPVTKVTAIEATASGSMLLTTGTFIEHGHVWSNSTDYPTLDYCTGFSKHGSRNGAFNFVSKLTDLYPNLTYIVRAYAKTQTGLTIYGDPVVFRTEIVEIDKGIIFYYPFSGNRFDLSGNGYNLSSEMGTPSYTDDRFGSANNACHFSVGKWYGGRLVPVTDFTVSLWFRKNGSWEPAQEHLIQIGDQYNGLTEERIFIAQEAGTASFSAGLFINGSLGTKYKVSLNSYPTLNVWHHVVAQRKGSTFYLYLDGELMGSTFCPSSELPTSYYYNIGGAWIPGYQQFHGDLDEVRFYSRALTYSEIHYLSKN